MYSRILVPLDGSEIAEKALETARGVLTEGGLLILCRVLTSDPKMGWDPVDFESLREREEKLVQAYLAEIESSQGSVSVKTLVAEGPVAEAILQVSEEQQAELIVLSSHGRSGVSRWFLGSVAERVVRYSSCPVLVCKTGPKDQDRS